MKTKSVPFSWIKRWGLRLDCGPYLSGAVDARIKMESHRLHAQKLRDVTTTIFHAGRESRTWVTAQEYGVPFLSSSDILKADLTDLPLLSKKQVQRNPGFLIQKGWTLISRSGTIGRMVYVRPDMNSMACSEHAMRVVPDEAKIPPGYLSAFLQSRFGVPMVIGGTYGSIIQSIEPEHIEELPVPRLGESVEKSVHQLFEKAAKLRANAATAMNSTVSSLPEKLGLRPLLIGDVSKYSQSQVRCSQLEMRLDAPYHCAAACEVEKQLDECGHPVEFLPKVLSSYFKPPLFKRLWVDGPEHGTQFISGVDAYRYGSESERYVSKKTPNFDQFILHRGWVIFQAAGQIYGLFGQPLFVSGWLEELFCADDMYRLVPCTVADGAYLFAFLRTPHGQVLIKRQACGNSIPRVWDPHMRKVRVPWPRERTREAIAAVVLTAHDQIEEARLAELQAIHVVEQAIEEAS